MPHALSKVSPIVAIAASSVIVFSLVGVGVMTGMIPSSYSKTEPSVDAARIAPAPLSAAPAAPATAPVTAAQPAPAAEAPRQRTARTRVAASRACASCGTVKSVNLVEHAGEGTGLGAVAGGVVGGVLGNQVGHGNGRTVATVAGAAGGAYAGHQIEKHVKTTKSWNVVVRMQDGGARTFHYASEPGFRAGDPVKVIDGQLATR